MKNKQPARKRPRRSRPNTDLDQLLPLFDLGGSTYIGYRIALVAKLFDGEIQLILKRLGDLTLPQWRALSQLGMRQEATIRILAEGAAVDRAETSRAINQLTKLGLVKRRENSTDARRPLFSLSEEGQETFTYYRDQLDKFIEWVVADTDEADLLAANRVLRVIASRCVGGLDSFDRSTQASQGE